MLKMIIFNIKDATFYIPVATSSATTIKNYQNFLANDLKDQYLLMKIKQKARI